MKDTSEAHLVPVTVQGRLGAIPGNQVLLRGAGPTAPPARKNAQCAHTLGAWRKSQPNAPRARKTKRKGDTAGAQH